MGKKKLTVIDDSIPEEVKNSKEKVKKMGHPEQSEGSVEEVDSSDSPQNDNDVEAETSEKTDLPTHQPTEITKASKEEVKSKKTKKPGRAKQRSKAYLEKLALVDPNTKYPLKEAVELVKQLSLSKFDGSVELHANTKSLGIRGLLSLPFATGKKLTIMAFGDGAKDCGADLVGTDETIEEIKAGKVNFDILITTPDWMAKLAPAAKVLGPKGLMPNPKNNTITTDLRKTVEEFQAGKTEYKTESKALVIHLNIGKISQPEEELSQNVKAFYTVVGKSRVTKMTLTPTMGPSVKLDLSSI